jgi:ABC-type Co2+ transport system permease subunit
MNRHVKVAPMLVGSVPVILAGIPAACAFSLRPFLDVPELMSDVSSSSDIVMFLSSIAQVLFFFWEAVFTAVLLYAVNQLLSEMTIDDRGVILKDAFWSTRIPWSNIAA